MPAENQFKIQINFTKAYEEGGNAYIEGIASGPEVDLTGERMSVDALKTMVESLYRNLIELRDAHRDEWNDDLGEIVELSLTEDNHLFYKAKLDLNLSAAQDLWYRITQKSKQYGVSIGGKVVKAGFEYVAELGRQVYTYFDVDLFEISITRQAAYQYSFANAVTKSLPTKEEPMSKPTQAVEKTDEQEATEINAAETETQAETAAETDTTTDATETEATEEEATEEETEEAAADADATAEESEEAESTEAEVDESTDAAEEQSTIAAVDEVAKAAVLGAYAEADVVWETISTLSYNLRWFIEDVMMDGDKDTAEKQSLIAAALAEFTRLITQVSNALMDSGVSEEAAKAMQASRDVTEESLSKSLTEKDTTVAELTKSLSDSKAELETAQKSLTETDEKLKTKTEELETVKARKSHAVVGKFDGVELTEKTKESLSDSPTMNRWINSL